MNGVMDLSRRLLGKIAEIVRAPSFTSRLHMTSARLLVNSLHSSSIEISNSYTNYKSLLYAYTDMMNKLDGKTVVSANSMPHISRLR